MHIGASENLMHDALHFRANVKVICAPKLTVLKKAKSHRTHLSVDRDFGDEQISLMDSIGVAIRLGVTVSDLNAGSFPTIVTRINGRRGDTFAIDKPLNIHCMIANSVHASTTFPVISGYDVPRRLSITYLFTAAKPKTIISPSAQVLASFFTTALAL